MLLTVRQRQTRLKALGLYEGKIDGKNGKLTKAAYAKLQNKYFTRAKDKDGGIYGKDTDILLRNAYAVKLYCKNFKLTEFKCGCGGRYCTGYPVRLNVQLLKNIQSIRSKYGATTITSGMRCKPYNNSLEGSSSTSRHMKGKAIDFVNDDTQTTASRRKVMSYIKKLPKHNYTYCNEDGSVPNMRNAIHFDVR